MSTNTFDLVIRSEEQRRSAAAWLLLGVASLLGAGLFSLLLVVARTPAVQEWLPVDDFFRVALVVHVNLSVLIWLLAMAGVCWSLATTRDARAWDRFSFITAVLGTITIALSPFIGAGEPLMNNYVPVLQHPAFYAGLCLFTIGIAAHLLRCVLSRSVLTFRGSEPLSYSATLQLGSRLAAVITLLAIIAFFFSWLDTPGPREGQAYFEFLFWGSGHVLQFTHTLLMMVAWVVLAFASGCRFPLSPRLTATFLTIMALPVITVPFLYIGHEVVSPGHRLAFTELMKYGGLSCLPLGLAVLASFRGAEKPVGEGRVLRSALIASITLFGVGGILGFLVTGLDIVIPAHYHGSTVGVTIAFMGLCYYLLPRLGFGPVPERMASWQSIVYGVGQLMHVMGLAWSGGYGVQRKTPGLDQGVDRLGEVAGMGLMGLGGLISVIGGLMFLLVAYKSIRHRT